MDEKKIVQIAGEQAPKICDQIHRRSKYLRYYGVKGPTAYEKAIQFLMSKEIILLEIGNAILKGIKEKPNETIRAINQVRHSKNVKVWLNNDSTEE